MIKPPDLETNVGSDLSFVTILPFHPNGRPPALIKTSGHGTDTPSERHGADLPFTPKGGEVSADRKPLSVNDLAFLSQSAPAQKRPVLGGQRKRPFKQLSIQHLRGMLSQRFPD